MLSKPYLRNRLSKLLIPLFGLSLMVTALPSHAQRSYLDLWDGKYPSSLSDDNAGCALCHVDISGGGLNPYGVDIANSSAGNISARIDAVEGIDSDGDPTNSTNIVEIGADAQPGWACTAPVEVSGALNPGLSPCPPIADANGPYTGTEDQQVQFDGFGSDDPDGTITAYNWTFGDGNSGTGVDPTHTYTAAGTYDVSLVVTDNAGNQSEPSTTTASIEPGTQIPIADPNGPYSGTEGVALTFNGGASFDPDGGSITQWDWEFGDGNVGTGVEPSHTYIAAGTYTVTLTVVDDEGEISIPVDTTAEIEVDTDGDGVPDSEDNCTLEPNADQRDTNDDGFGNICDPDLDNNNNVDFADLAILKSVFFSLDPADEDADLDGDGLINFNDLAIMKGMFFGPPGPSGLVPLP